jgi:hypothetical protein
MQSLTFVFEATLLAPLVEFATSTSGHVEPRQGLALGWLGSVVAGLAVVFGTAERTQADSCHGISEGAGESYNCSDVCLDDPCRFNHNGDPIGWYRAKYCHSENNGCQQKGAWSCSC